MGSVLVGIAGPVSLSRVAWSTCSAIKSTRITNLLIEAVQALPDGFAVWDRNDRLALINPAVAEHIGPHVACIGETLEGAALRRDADAVSRLC